jgi:hypothetical protein
MLQIISENTKNVKRATVARVHAGEVCELEPGHTTNHIGQQQKKLP